LWTYYGLIKSGGLLISTINGAGAVLEAVYVILFIIYARKEVKLKIIMLVLLVDVVFFTAVFLVTFLALSHDARITVIGVLCVCLTLTMYGSPLAIMRKVMVTKSVEFMPFFLSFFLFLNGGVWAVWAVLKHDIFVGIPNGIGFGLGAAQLLLYMIYRKGNPRGEGIREEYRKTEGFKIAEDIEMGGGNGHGFSADDVHGLRNPVQSLSLDSGKLQSYAGQQQDHPSPVTHHEGKNSEGH